MSRQAAELGGRLHLEAVPGAARGEALAKAGSLDAYRHFDRREDGWVKVALRVAAPV